MLYLFFVLAIVGMVVNALYYDYDYFFVIVLIAVAVFLGIVDAHTYQLEVTDDVVLSKGLFQTKKWNTTDIEGIDTRKGGFVFISKSTKKKLLVNSYLANYDELQSWANMHFENKSIADYNAEIEEVLNDETLGGDADERVKKVEKARYWTKRINIASWVLPLMLFVFREYTDKLFPVLLCFPLWVIVFIAYNKGLVKVYDTREDKEYFYPNALTALVFPSIAIALFTVLKYDIYDYKPIWTWVAGWTVLLTYVTMQVSKELQFKRWRELGTALLLTLFFAFYSYGSLVGVNCISDKSEPTVFYAEIAKKYIADGKLNSHNIKLNAWGPQSKETTIENLKATVYEQLSEGDSIALNYYPGSFGAGWYKMK